jgi:hypothetical protein
MFILLLLFSKEVTLEDDERIIGVKGRKYNNNETYAFFNDF